MKSNLIIEYISINDQVNTGHLGLHILASFYKDCTPTLYSYEQHTMYGVQTICKVCNRKYILYKIDFYCDCISGYYLQSDGTNDNCIRCHTSCASCFGPYSHNCLTCSYHFTYSNADSTCSAPNNQTLQTLVETYNFYGFNIVAGWTMTNFATSSCTSTCKGQTLLGCDSGTAGNIKTISTTVNNLKYHFQIRIKTGFYFFNYNNNNQNAVVTVTDSGTQNFAGEEVAADTCNGASYVNRNIDANFTHSITTATTITITASSTKFFGIREFFLILKLCNSTNCSTCTGYLDKQCLTCVDSKRIATYSFANHICTCTGSYYQQPFAGSCVDPCPSVPIKYYGDNSTRSCVLKCPAGTYANDDSYQCWADCPLTSSITLKVFFKDQTNGRCVSNCPSTQPYGNQMDHKCYSICPANFFATDAIDKRCVTVCPNDNNYKLYAYLKQCVAYCPSGYFADTINFVCVAAGNCPAAIPYHDISTGLNRCVANCPSPSWFAQNTNKFCVKTCPSPQFGQTNQLCINQCGSPRWGLLTGNRICVTTCPANTWGQPTSRTCVQSPAACSPLYANNFTRTCVAAASCPFGTFAENTTHACIVYCPIGSYGHTMTKYCQSQCGAPYFKDAGIGLCVLTCVTQDTYADPGSSYTCVTQCNTAGGYPWADSSSKTCVNDCNQTVAGYVADNTTWTCVYNCPANWYVDTITTAPICVQVCPNGYFADDSTETGLCVLKCSTYPPKFGDATNNINLCVSTCSTGLYGDQTGNRLCVANCPNLYFAQNDATRLCVKKCKDLTYGYNNFCWTDPHSCPSNYFGNDYTNLCVNPCPIQQGIFGDPEGKKCVRLCPNNPAASPTTSPNTYYADVSSRQCVLTCSASYSTGLFGNNDTRTCLTACKDQNSYAEVQTTNRICVARCLWFPIRHYANNYTQVCGPSINCQTNYYGQNSSQICVESCPSGSYAYKNAAEKVCIDICPVISLTSLFADDSTGKRICVAYCPITPELFADPVTRKCVATCPSPLYGDGSGANRTCVSLCPANTYSYSPTRRCLSQCPSGYFGDDTPTVRKCQSITSDCTYGFGDPYLHKCVTVCSGPSPVNLFGSGLCPDGTYADSYTGSRLCVALCPPGDTSINSPNLYGDPTTHTCVGSCLTTNTWADYQTRLCKSSCSASPIPTYSERFGMTCVISTLCPTSPSMTFGDSNSRSCQSTCSLGKFGDPISRNCVTQCLNAPQIYYGDTSTGQYICVTICPVIPRLFGKNSTNLCVTECPDLTYGDQTGKRTCVPQCPVVGTQNYYAQDTEHICVKVCEKNTWGLTSSRKCVTDPLQCGLQWAQNESHLCLTTCPISLNLYGNPTTKLCVPTCPSGSYADDMTRTCVTACPVTYGAHGTFGNNNTNICEQYCQQASAFADSQTLNRYCVLKCSQTPNAAYADSSSKSCVSQCPSHPDLFGQTQNFTCVSVCPSPYFADTNTRMCVTSCSANQFRNRNPNLCMAVCPANPEKFGDPNTLYCQTSCSNGYYRYTTTRMCVASCQTYSLLEYNLTCVQYCPFGFYANSAGNCVNNCPGGTFGQNTTTKCQSTCITGFAYSGKCLAQCPDGMFGENHVCQAACTGGRTASNADNLCVSTCVVGEFMENGVCVTVCTGLNYADPSTRLCSSSCTNMRYGDPTSKTCVQICPTNYYRDSTGYCLSSCSPKLADKITWSCTIRCSDGLWGYNFNCVSLCPAGYYAYSADRNCYNTNNQPAAGLFAQSNAVAWVFQCPLSPLKFGDRNTKTCVGACTVSTEYADPVSRQCQTTCTGALYFRDPMSKSCVLTCPQNYYANPITKDCETHCTNAYYDYLPQRSCVQTCLRPYYGHQVSYKCVLQCPTNYYAHEEANICKMACPTPYFADPSTNRCVLNCINSFATITTRKCVSDCVASNEIADNSTNTCVSRCPSEPDYYKQNHVCVTNCAVGTFADPTTNVRQCVSLCTTGLYGDPVSGRCLTACLPGYWAQNTTNLCVNTCITGFADNTTGYCHRDCPAPSFADLTNRKCMKTCSGNLFGQGRVCVSSCTLPNFANPLSRECGLTCPAFDYLFAQTTTASCVSSCSIIANSYADRNTRSCNPACTLANQYALDGQAICTSLCPQGMFMENSTKKCVSVCLQGYAQPTTRYCVQRCFGSPQTYAHTPTKTCIYNCHIKDSTLFGDNSTNLCVNTCPQPAGYYSDPLSGNCVLFCPEGYYAEDQTRTCTPICLVGYADNLTRKCVSQCPQSQQTFGTEDHLCLRICPTDWYAENISQTCKRANQCPINTWSDDKSKYCVSRCPSEPVLYFGLSSTSSCVVQCPIGGDLYGDYITQTCVSSCSSVNSKVRFRDPISRTCVFQCPISNNLYGDLQSQRCESICTNHKVKDNSTQMCVATCPSDPSYYADLNTYSCVRTCPNGYYASDQTIRKCVTSCFDYGATYADSTTNRCTPKGQCPFPYYSDNKSSKCVLDCPEGVDYYADPYSGNCVLNCPAGSGWILYADPVSRTCVTRCPSSYFGVNSTQRCLTSCPVGQYAEELISICVADCTIKPNRYKQLNARICVSDCPTTPVKAHKYDVDQTCVYSAAGVSGCPGAYYANPLDNMCTTLCPNLYFADSHSKTCVLACSVGDDQFADPVYRKCKSSCASNPQYYKYQGNNKCVQFCPDQLYRDNSTYKCVSGCPSSASLYAYDLSWQCVLNCPAPYYSYSGTQKCITVCPNGYFAMDSTRSCQTICNSPYFADSSTNRCVKLCPQIPDYYGYNNVCQTTCPNGWYRDNSSRLCSQTCPRKPLLFADSSTNTCVKNCPASENLFADNKTLTCSLTCSLGTFADVSTRTCVLNCPANLQTYADPTTKVCQPVCPSPYYGSNQTKQCVLICPSQPYKTYAYDPDRVCVPKCVGGLFGDNTTSKCKPQCPADLTAFADPTSQLCVSTCPVGYFADNSSISCVTHCPANYYADPTTRKCVSKCPGSQRLYADSSTWSCVTLCPKKFYGDDQTWKCIPNCPQAYTGVDRFVLEDANLCVEECPAPYFGLVDTKVCVAKCPDGLYGQLVTRRCTNCRSQCPTCLAYDNCLQCTANIYLQFGLCVASCQLDDIVASYANKDTWKCVSAYNCPANKYGNNNTKECSDVCPNAQYKNSTTRACQNCPQYCSACKNSTHCSACDLGAQYSTQDESCYSYCNSTHKYTYEGKCSAICPSGTYQDYTGVRCQTCNAICLTCQLNALNCTSCSGSFLYNHTCLAQCPSNFYSNEKVCLECTPDVTSCVTPLTFTATTTTENYKNVVVIKFNKKTIVSGNPGDYIKVKLKLSRLLQSSADISKAVNQGFAYANVVILPDGTIKLVLDSTLTLLNPQFEIVFTDPNQIVAEGGGTLQLTQTSVILPQGQQMDYYPPGTTNDSSLIVVGTIFSIVFLVGFFSMFLIGALPIYLTIQAFQLTSLAAFTSDLAPNLFYFLRELRITRLTFLPSIFSELYYTPTGYNQGLPPKVPEVDGYLSFSITAGGWIWIPLIYCIFALFVYLLTTKIHSNRSLKNLMTGIYQTRVKVGLLNDVLWIFTINVVFCGLIQFRRSDLGGQLAFASLSFIFFISLMFGMFIYGVYKWKQDPESLQKNYLFLTMGTKEHQPAHFIAFFYHFRRLALLIAVTSSIFDGLSQSIICLAIFSIMFIALVIIRPYENNFYNLIHIAHQGGQIFVWSAIIYHISLVNKGEDVGTKVLWGQITTIILTIYLSLMLIWGTYRSVLYISYLIAEFKATEFYKLHLDSDYTDQIEKELSQLKDAQEGEIQSVNVTNFGEEEDEIIRLKIKRKKRKVKTPSQQISEQKPLKSKINIMKQNYVKLDLQNEQEYSIKKDRFQKIIIQEEKWSPMRNQREQKSKWDDSWIPMKQSQGISQTVVIKKQQQENIFEGQFDENISQLVNDVQNISQLDLDQENIVKLPHNADIQKGEGQQELQQVQDEVISAFQSANNKSEVKIETSNLQESSKFIDQNQDIQNNKNAENNESDGSSNNDDSLLDDIQFEQSQNDQGSTFKQQEEIEHISSLNVKKEEEDVKYQDNDGNIELCNIEKEEQVILENLQLSQLMGEQDRSEKHQQRQKKRKMHMMIFQEDDLNEQN